MYPPSIKTKQDLIEQIVQKFGVNHCFKQFASGKGAFTKYFFFQCQLLKNNFLLQELLFLLKKLL